MEQIRNVMDFNYDVFLSYRHKPRDNRICKKTHTLLETFKPPRRQKKAAIRRVFRDDAELPVAGVLSDTIGDALKSARILLVICSKDTPESQWVDREVRTFIELGRSDKIFALLIEGDSAQSFPHSLKLVPGIENRTLRIAAHSEKQSVKKLKKELLRVISAATETPYDPLRISVRNRRIRRSILVGAALSVFLFASGLYSLYQWNNASYYNLYAQREELLIHDIIQTVSFDLTGAVESLPGTTDAMAKILTDNIEYIDRIMDIGGASEQLLSDKGNNYLNLARTYMKQGDINKTTDNTKKAIEIFETLDKNSSSASIKNKLALCYNLAGIFMQSVKSYDDSVGYLKKAVTVYKELEGSDTSQDYLTSQADCFSGIGLSYYYNRDYVEAADSFIKEVTLRREIAGNSPSPENQATIANLTLTVGQCLMAAQDYERAAPYNTEAVKEWEAVHKQNTDAKSYKSYVFSLYTLGNNLIYLKDDENAEYYLKLCVVEGDKLVKEFPDFEPSYFCLYAMYDLLFAEDTDAKKEEALNLTSLAYEANPGDAFVRIIYAYAKLSSGQYDDALAVLNSMIDEKLVTAEDIGSDLNLFSVRRRAPEDAERLKEDLKLQ